MKNILKGYILQQYYNSFFVFVTELQYPQSVLDFRICEDNKITASLNIFSAELIFVSILVISVLDFASPFSPR